MREWRLLQNRYRMGAFIRYDAFNGEWMSVRPFTIVFSVKILFAFPVVTNCENLCLIYITVDARDHSRKRPALVTTTIVKSRLKCHSNSLMKSSRKRPLP